MSKPRRFYNYVIRKTTSDMYGAFYDLECGHEVYRYGKRRPLRLKCIHCEWAAERKEKSILLSDAEQAVGAVKASRTEDSFVSIG